jgi:hypothetical protein
MKNKFFIIIVILFCFSISCKSDKKSMDKIISNYYTTNFSNLKNIFIENRGMNNEDIILIVSKYNQHNCNPYIIWVNSKTKEISKIDDKLPVRDCGAYFTNVEIKTYVDYFLKQNFMVLGVDNEDNVYINPYYYDVPILLRKSKKSNPKDLKDFKLYKGDWYIKK